jgi:hypothetical protein
MSCIAGERRVVGSADVGRQKGALMHAVVVRSTLQDLERATTFLREQTLPRVRQAPGLVSAQWVKIDENTGASMLTFESEEAAQTAVEQLSKNPPPTDALTIDSVEIGEVVERI